MIKAMTSAIGGVLTAVILIVVVVGACVGITLGGIELNAWLSKPAGNAQVTTDTNNGTNQEASSGIFAQLLTTISGDEYKIKQGAATHPADGSDEANAIALESADCVAAVDQYNADAQTDTMRPNLPYGDPTSISEDVCNVPDGD
jgi:hypothetical protein